ncbi:MAG: hypothetical protein ACR2HR_10400 [Euzebya sp.]
MSDMPFDDRRTGLPEANPGADQNRELTGLLTDHAVWTPVIPGVEQSVVEAITAQSASLDHRRAQDARGTGRWVRPGATGVAIGLVAACLALLSLVSLNAFDLRRPLDEAEGSEVQMLRGHWANYVGLVEGGVTELPI